MKLTIERDAFQGAIGRVAKCAGKGSTIPILGHILLRATADALTVVGSDLDIVAATTAPARVTRDGALTVPARMIQDIVARSPSGAQIAIEETDDGRTMTLKVGRSRIVLQALLAADFPELPIADLTHEFVVEAKTFSKLLDRIDFAISSEETRIYLCGAFLHCHEGNLRAVATDGHRLATHDMPAPLGSQDMPGVIIPRKTVQEIIRIGKDAAGGARVRLNTGKLVIDFEGGTQLVSKLIEGTYPDYLSIIPKDHPKRATLDRDAFGEAVARLAAVAGDTRMRLHFAGDLLQIAVNNPNAGEAVDEMETDFHGEDLEIGFAGNYLRDTVAALDCDRFVALFDTPGSPALFEPIGDSTLLLLLMPRRV